MNVEKKVIVILGPSASGKTNLALEIAKKLGRSVLSADSRQIYRGLDYSTGKIRLNSKTTYTKGEGKWILDRINYWGYDVIEPNAEFSAGDFVNFTKKVLREENNTPIICGGTGLYIAAITGKVPLTKVPKNPQLREGLKEKSIEELHKNLEDLGFNLSSLNESELSNKQRLIRRVEIISSKKTKDIRYNLTKHVPENDYLFIGLKRKEYRTVIEKWIEENFEEIEREVAEFLKIYPHSPLFSGFIFKEMKYYIKGFLNRKETEEKIVTSYLQYIKRQMTYFKKYFPETKWFGSQDEALEKYKL